MELVLMVKRFGALKLKVVERTVWAWVLTIRRQRDCPLRWSLPKPSVANIDFRKLPAIAAPASFPIS